MQDSQLSSENDDMTNEDALACLKDAGLIATLYDGSRILGSYAVRTEDGLRQTIDPFRIYLDKAEWVVEIPVRQCYLTVKRSSKLREVVNSICDLYRPQTVPVRPSMTIRGALMRLKSARLLAKYVGGDDRLISGGRTAVRKDRYKIFSEPFAISRMGFGWLATIGGCENLAILRSAGTLQEAVEAICDFYASKPVEE